MREQGYYWVSIGGGEPQIADYWIDKISGEGEWTTLGSEEPYADPRVEVLSERLLPPEKKP